MEKQLVYQVAVGEVPAFYHDCIRTVAAYAKRIGADHIVQTKPLLRIRPEASQRSVNALRLGYLPIYEKENALAYLGRYDQVAVIDADIYIRPTAPSVFEELQEAQFAAVVERDMPLTAAYADKVRKHSFGQFNTLRDVDWQWDDRGAHYYNMGMMVLDASLQADPVTFLRRPEFARFINGEGHWRWSTDQTLLNWWLKKDGIKTRDLNWRWNGLYNAVHGIDRAHFVHLFLSAKLANPQAIVRSL